MKRIMLTLAITCIVGLSQAAAVKWSSGSYSDGFKGPTGDSLASSTAYTAIAYFYSDSEGKTLVTSSTDTSASKGAYGLTTGDLFNPSTTYYTKLVVTANDNSYQITSALASFTVPETGNGNINYTTGSNFDVASPKIDSSAGWTAVPEPTSFGLVLLGIAGLALKRKIA